MFELKDIPLFSALKEEQLKLLQAQMHIHQYLKDSVVFYEGDQSKYLQILLDGTVRLYKTELQPQKSQHKRLTSVSHLQSVRRDT